MTGITDESVGASPESGNRWASGWWDITKRVWAHIGEHNVSIMAAGVAFYALLSIFPGLTALISLYGLIANPSDIEHLL